MKQLVFAYDIGIGQTAWAVVDASTREVLESGVNNFPSGDASNNQERRKFRQTRRVHRRKSNRINDFKKLWKKNGFSIPKENEVNILSLRLQGLSKLLTEDELFCVLRYMLKKRGISYLEDDIDENMTGEYQRGIALNQKELLTKFPCQIQAERFEKYGVYRGNQTIVIDNELVNVRNVFTTDAYKKEVEEILATQVKGNSRITKEFVQEYMDIFSRKRKYYIGPGNELSRTDYGVYTTREDENGRYITDENLFDKLIGKCFVYPNEKRGAGASYTAQEFNALNDLNNLVINGRKFEEEEKKKIIEEYKNANFLNLNATRVRKIFETVIGEKIESLDGFRIDKSDGEIYHTMEIYRRMKAALTEKGLSIEDFSAEDLDIIGRILTLNTEKDGIIEAFQKGPIICEKEKIEVFISMRRKNANLFSKWQSLSIKIMTELIPELYCQPKNQMVLLTEMGVFRSRKERFSDCSEIPINESVEDIYNPVVRRSVSVAYQITNKLLKKYGYPYKVVIEMPRETNSEDEKKKINDIQKDNQKELDVILKRIYEEYGVEVKKEEFRHHKGLALKLKLWNEQGGRCLYSGKVIPINELISNQGMFEVDHIIPISISFNDSRSNKALVYAIENQKKGNKTPFGYLATTKREWNYDTYCEYVKSLGYGKKKTDYYGKNKLKNLLFEEDITKYDVIQGFINRNLNDTRYVSREVLNTLQDFFKAQNAKTIVSVIRGSFTHQMRENLRIEKNRDEDFRHHAVDAMLIAYSQLGYDVFLARQKQIVDFETGEILSKCDWDNQDDYYKKLLYQETWYKTVQEIRMAEKQIKFSHKENRKCNRGLCDQTIYGTRVKDGDIWAIGKLDLYDNKDMKQFKNMIEKGKEKNFLMYENDPRTFEDLMKIFNEYKDAENPFVAYQQATNDVVRKYAKNHDGAPIKKIKYRKEKVNSCLDISHKYGHEKGSKKVLLMSLNPYRMDVYRNKKTGLYRFVGVKQSDIKCFGKTRVIDEEAYAKILLSEKMLDEGEKRLDLPIHGWEFCLSFYKENIIEYEKGGEVYKERFLSRTKPATCNCIETKPVDAEKFEKQNQVALSKTTSVKKIITDILGNEKVIEKEKFVETVGTIS